MSAEQRQQQIIKWAREAGSVDVSQLAAAFSIAPETARRDLKALVDRGLLRRTHGGAYPVESAGFETSLAVRTTRNVAAKQRIAEAAVEEVRDAETIFIDEGFTPQLIAERLPDTDSYTIVTASLPVAAALSVRPSVSVLMLGGRVRGRTTATVDHWATDMLSTFTIDLAFVGANGVSRDRGLTTPDPAVAHVKSMVFQVARRVVFAGIHSKFGAVSFCRFADAAQLHTIVTDAGLPTTEAHRYSLLGPNVIRV